MAYKVLNNVLVKDAANISSLTTDMLVLVINKNTKNDSSFKELNKKSKSIFLKLFNHTLTNPEEVFCFQKLMELMPKIFF